LTTACNPKTSPNHSPFDIHNVPDIPKVVQKNFDGAFVTLTTRVVDETSSEHGAKLVVELQDGISRIETVIIRHKQNGRNRTTVCVSSQVGCQMACTFCATGTMGLQANLWAAEIVEQVVHARARYPELNNVVFMGMGEPLDNYENVIESIQSMTDPAGLAIPVSKITLSTVGVSHAIQKLARDCPNLQLALSLHAPNDVLRKEIVPTTKAFSIAKILAAVKQYQKAGGKRIMIEYILIDGINSSVDVAHQLGKLLVQEWDLDCVVNLIPYNPTEAGDRYNFRAPTNEQISQFQNALSEYRCGSHKKMLRCTVRWSSQRGQDIDAACGQLALKKSIQSSKNTDNNNGDMEDLMLDGSSHKNHPSKISSRKTRLSQSKNIVSSQWWNKYYWLAIACAGVSMLGMVAMMTKIKRRG
jgi:23S rRNA (adenine(2503)-C(2))-methyltransferase